MKAIILAAGRGSRMGVLTNTQPKCMTSLFGKKLINWQFSALNNKHISEIGIVVGYLKKSFKFKKKYFINENWENSNMVASLLKADNWLRQGTNIISYSDIVYEKKIIDQLIKAKGDIIITYDKNWLDLWNLRFDNPLDDAESFQVKDQILYKIGEKVDDIKNIEGQYMGLLKFTKNGWLKTSYFLNTLNKDIIDNLDMTMLLKKLIDNKFVINCIPITGNWLEVDTESDLKKYHQKFNKKFLKVD